MKKLNTSVGRGGTNKSVDDIRLIQGLLNNYKIPGATDLLLIDGKIGKKTITRIELFQRKILNVKNPNGRIDMSSQIFDKLTHRPNTKSASSYTTSTKALNLLKSIEELRLKPYDDQNGDAISKWVDGATIGYGHLIAKNDWNKYKNGLSKEESEKLFKEDLVPFAFKVKNKVTANITQHEFDALVILTFNIGKSGFTHSSVLKLVNNPGAKTAYSNLTQAWRAWNKTQGKYSQGLVNRRKAELKIYTRGIYKKW